MSCFKISYTESFLIERTVFLERDDKHTAMSDFLKHQGEILVDRDSDKVKITAPEILSVGIIDSDDELPRNIFLKKGAKIDYRKEN